MVRHSEFRCRQQKEVQLSTTKNLVSVVKLQILYQEVIRYTADSELIKTRHTTVRSHVSHHLTLITLHYITVQADCTRQKRLKKLKNPAGLHRPNAAEALKECIFYCTSRGATNFILHGNILPNTAI